MREHYVESTMPTAFISRAAVQSEMNAPLRAADSSLIGQTHERAGQPSIADVSALKKMRASNSFQLSRSVLQLQRLYGNRYVQRALELSRQADESGEVAPEVESSIERSRGGGQSMDGGVRGQMESAFGSDFGGVRIHTGSEAHSLNRAVSAVAFTTGKDIFFRDGAYDPGTSGGRELLAHELTHVVQQGGASQKAGVAQRFEIQRMCPSCEEEKKKVQGKLVVGSPGDQYEQEAERVAKRVLSMPPRVASAEVASSQSSALAQRQDDDDSSQGHSTEVAVDGDMPSPGADEESAAESPIAQIARMHEGLAKDKDTDVTYGRPATPVLQRWHADGPASTTTNTIVCDGAGGVRTQLGGTGDATQTACLSDCIRQHEESHRADALAANATICGGKANGSQVTFNGEQSASEIKASNVEIACLQAKLPTAGTCRDAVNARITQITAYRDSFH